MAEWYEDDVTDLHLPDMGCCEDDAKDRWRECIACGCPIGDTDELCRSLTCHLYNKRAIAPLTNARSASTFTDREPLISAHCSSGTVMDEATTKAVWDRLIERSIF